MAFMAGGIELVSRILIETSLNKSTIDLVVITFLIVFFVNLYKESGLLEGLGNELVKLFRKPVLVVTLTPAILGFLPIPGGALMSAPIVDVVGDSMGLRRNRKLFFNVWFRHIIFLVYPLSTTIIIASGLAGVDLWSLIVWQTPAVFIMIVVGILMGLPKGSRGGEKSLKTESLNAGLLIRGLMPIIVSIILAVILSPLIDNVFPLPIERLSMIIGVLIGIIILIVLSNPSAENLLKALISGMLVEIVLAAYGAMFLKDAFNACGASDAIGGLVGDMNPTLLLAILPFILAFITGSPLSSIVLSIPLLQPIISMDARETSITYISALLGYIPSPLHLCYIYSASYFETTLTKGYRYMLPATILTMIIVLGIYTIPIF